LVGGKIMVLPNGVYLIENNIYTQQWTDPDTINLANFILGDTYLTFYAKEGSTRQSNDLAFEAFQNGYGFALPAGVFVEEIPIDGFLDSIVERNKAVKFFMRHRKNSQQKVYYIIKVATGEFIEFPDPTDTMQKYCPGYLKELSPVYMANVRVYQIKGSFQVVWGIF
jgi:hypothetical protein